MQKGIKFTTYNFNQTRDTNISVAKRGLDIVGALAIITLISPILLIIALAIKVDSKGPIIYRSRRIGRGYQKFDFFKFRSMYQDADERLKQLIHLNQYANGEETENCFIKIKNDPRITKIGQLIRKTSLDELPQLFNVLRGEMSLVGNRPLPLYEAELMVRDEWAMRFIAPAGLTGLWQVSKRGKNDMSTAERVALDVEYAQNHSFFYDMKLLLKTLPAMIQEEDV
ncbi:MAG: sugar transferase [Saprospiraceae bacterium]|nr:sugar transferase [Saprospiraceae bacterium]